MPQTEFERDNLARAYPLVDTHVPEELLAGLADASFIVRPGAKYIHGLHRIRISSFGSHDGTQAALLGVPGTDTHIAFRCNAPGIKDQLQLVAFSQGDDIYAEVEARVIPATMYDNIVYGIPYPAVPTLPAEHLWEGFAVIGDPAELLVAPGPLVPAPYLEPARVMNTSEPSTRRGWTRVYNQVLTQYTHPSGCQDLSDPLPIETGQYLLSYGPFRGEFYLAGGHATSVTQNSFNRTINLFADGSGGELGHTCGQIPPAPGIDDTDTSLQCDEVLRSINGIGGPNLGISAGNSIVIGRYPDQHRIVIAAGGKDSMVCPAKSDPEPVEYLPTSNDIPCGDDGMPLPPPPGLPDDSAGYLPSEMVHRLGGSLMSAPDLPCVWHGNGSGGWILVSNGCSSPNVCEYPNEASSGVDDIWDAPCGSLVDEDSVFVLNPDFLHPHNPLAAWDTMGDVTVQSELPGIPSHALPVVRMVAGEVPAKLLQRMISVTSNSTYLLTFECRVTQGSAVIALGQENHFATAHELQVSPSSHGAWDEATIGPLAVAAGPLRLVVTASPHAIVDIGQFALIRQT